MKQNISLMLILLLIILMMSFPVSAEENDPFKNIEKTDQGYLLSESQIIKLANYIAELKAENEKLDAQLKQANIELEKAYNDNSRNDILKRVGDGLTGAGLAALLILIAQGLGG